MPDPHRPLGEGKIAALRLLKQGFDDADGRVVKRFKHEAPTQWRVLDEFEADGWKGSIEIAPPGAPTRDTSQRLRELIADLNAALDTSLIHFRNDAGAGGIAFDLP